jgi:CDP-diacylglycerol---serine O-phosphatidyltransferase
MRSKQSNFGQFKKRGSLRDRLHEPQIQTQDTESVSGADGTAITPTKKRARGVYLLPNLFTTASLFSGFYAIVQAMNGRFEVAAIAIFISMVLDSLDGRVARWTNTQSAFGEQYDSLSDMVCFGVAPALIVYEWSLRGLGKLGWVAAFVYCAGAALRLARFNANLAVVDKRFFQGTDLRATKWITATPSELVWVTWALTIYAGVSMVSNSPFYSFKDLNFKRRVPFIFAAVMVAALLLISADPPSVLFVLFVVYGLSGHVLWVMRRVERRSVGVN